VRPLRGVIVEAAKRISTTVSFGFGEKQKQINNKKTILVFMGATK
jgi:hypothetical protein